MIGNGTLVALICLWFVRPVYLERVEELGTSEARYELMYLNGLVPLGVLVSTVVANLYLLLVAPIEQRVSRR